MLNHQKWIAAAVLALGIAPAGSGQAARQPETNDRAAQTLIAMERQWSESATPTDEIRVVQKIFAEDFLGTDTDGKLYTKSEKIAEEKARTSTGEVLSSHLDEVKVRFFGENLAVLYGRESSIRKSKEGKEYTRRVIWTDAWLKRDDHWQIIAAQDMMVQPNPPAPSAAQSEPTLIDSAGAAGCVKDYQPRSAEAAEIIKVENEWCEAAIRRDAARLDRVFADDISWVEADRYRDKGQVIHRYMVDVQEHLIELRDVRIRIFGDVAVVSSHVHVKKTEGGKFIENVHAATDFLQKINGRWQLVVE